MLELIIKQLLKYIGNVNVEQWNKAKELVVKAAIDLAHLPGSQRRAYVVETMKGLWSDLAPYLINLLVDGAFAFLKNKGIVV